MAQQLGLFGDEPPPRGAVLPAVPSAALVELGARLPEAVYLGTSSWSFPGWRGLVWREEHGEQLLARRGLGAYAAHPLLRSVGVDRTHYAPVTADVLAAYAREVPATFRFLVKAHEACTLAVYPSHPRYGAQRGQANPLFLDAGYARDHVVAPYVEGLGASAGPLVFQCAAQPMAQLGGSPRRFAERLYRFLRDLPRGPRYAVEVRNAKLLTPDYAAALRSAGAGHCINLIPGMPPPAVQRALTKDAGDALIVRWLLAPQHSYETALAAYQPFGALVDPDPPSREAIAALVRDAVAGGQPAWVIVNNKAEGSAPRSVAALAEAIVAPGVAPIEPEDDVPF